MENLKTESFRRGRAVIFFSELQSLWRESEGVKFHKWASIRTRCRSSVISWQKLRMEGPRQRPRGLLQLGRLVAREHMMTQWRGRDKPFCKRLEMDYRLTVHLLSSRRHTLKRPGEKKISMCVCKRKNRQKKQTALLSSGWIKTDATLAIPNHTCLRHWQAPVEALWSFIFASGEVCWMVDANADPPPFNLLETSRWA